MNVTTNFDASRWIAEAFRAGIFPRVNANGDLALDVVNASPADTELLLDQLSGNSEDVILRMPKPDSDQQYLN